MRLIVGLGNPGSQYRNTRHNLGFRVLDGLADVLGVTFSREKHGSVLADARFAGHRLVLVKPQTFMNRSGVAVAKVARNALQDPGDLLVVADDVNLPLGRIRFRARGAAGGHNGLKSVIEHLGMPDFARLRLGVSGGEGREDLTGHVLGSFRPEEWPEVDRMVQRSVTGAVRFIEAGIEAAMNEFNAESAEEAAQDEEESTTGDNEARP